MKINYTFAPNGLNKQGLGPVVVVVRIGNNFTKHIKTGILITPEAWSDRKKAIKSDYPNAYEMNMKARSIIHRIEKWEIDNTLAGFKITKELFLAWLENKPEEAEQFYFNTFYHNTLENDKTIRHSSYTDQRQTLVLLNDFNPKIKIEGMNRRLVDEFENYLIGCKLAQNTRKKHHKNLKKYINRAIDYGLFKITLDKHPYRSVRYPTKPGNREFLTSDEIERIKGLEYSGRIAEVKDLFLFCCFTGLRFSDSQELTLDNFSETALNYTPVKTDRHTGRVSVPLTEYFGGEALKIAQRYQCRLPKITNQEFNRYLKTIMVDADITKLLTAHVARHTFLTNIAKITGNVFKVMKLGGLRKTDTAMIYIHLAEV